MTINTFEYNVSLIGSMAIFNGLYEYLAKGIHVESIILSGLIAITGFGLIYKILIPHGVVLFIAYTILAIVAWVFTFASYVYYTTKS